VPAAVAFPSATCDFTLRFPIHEQVFSISVLCSIFHRGVQYHRIHGHPSDGRADIQSYHIQGHCMVANRGILDAGLRFPQQITRINPK
jgi:hypothetical protein